MFFYVANWKMNMSFSAAIAFCRDNYDDFVSLSQREECKIVLCPSFTEIHAMIRLFEDTCIAIGAQDCSAHHKGAYTGQVRADSLSDLGCNYCLVGHSERREYCAENSEDVAKKVARLLDVMVTPIICVGEREDAYKLGKTKDVLIEQLVPICEIIGKYEIKKLFIAYEPVWVIGTGLAPQKQYVAEVFGYISKIIQMHLGEIDLRLLYGGSVSDDNAREFKSIANMSGFLIGGMSLDFQKFEKIVTL